MASSNIGIQTGSAWFQRKINLRPQHRGVHLVTEEILRQIPELSQFSIGLCHIQILHTSASLALNESWDPDVRDDMEMMLNKIIPEEMPYRHSCEGPDDMISRKRIWKTERENRTTETLVTGIKAIKYDMPIQKHLNYTRSRFARYKIV
ncbi:UPF0047 protein YjbQ isoform X2 [Cotesia glomerata]|uniref:Uncharacterized protein n=1 Tax=Cotesia glomerata TaxID=32391 RepID=A0AAV7I2H4_COTGL|nr:UPF0047 protein YjbQ isoform X2 [Cotesia glomerata]KAH0540034.1 hypothetical protein KQX54_011432 [Cotesia glomerata]